MIKVKQGYSVAYTENTVFGSCNSIVRRLCLGDSVDFPLRLRSLGTLTSFSKLRILTHAKLNNNANIHNLILDQQQNWLLVFKIEMSCAGRFLFKALNAG